MSNKKFVNGLCQYTQREDPFICIKQYSLYQVNAYLLTCKDKPNINAFVCACSLVTVFVISIFVIAWMRVQFGKKIGTSHEAKPSVI